MKSKRRFSGLFLIAPSEYPGGFKHNKHGGLMRELLEKVAERYV